jgi:hypothetical protein
MHLAVVRRGIRQTDAVALCAGCAMVQMFGKEVKR